MTFWVTVKMKLPGSIGVTGVDTPLICLKSKGLFISLTATYSLPAGNLLAILGKSMAINTSNLEGHGKVFKLLPTTFTTMMQIL